MSYDSGKTGAEVMAALAKADGALQRTGGTVTGAIEHDVGGGIETVQMRVDGSTFNESVPDFVFGGLLHSGVNLPAGYSSPNAVYNIGWNVGTNGAPLVVGQPALRIAFENNFANPGRPLAYEWHLSFYDTDGFEHRPISSYLHKDGSRGSDISFNSDIIGINDDRYVQKIKLDLLNHRMDFNAPIAVRSATNNHAWLKQSNAAGNAFLSLPFIDTDDRIRTEAPVVYVGPIPTTGSYAGTFAAFQAIGSKNNDRVISTIVGNLTGSVYSIHSDNECTQDAIIAHNNNTNAATANAVIWLRTIGAGAGDPFIRFDVNGGGNWAVGLDNSDDDSFVFSELVTGNSNRCRISRAGDLSVSRTLAAGKFPVASLPAGSEGQTAYATDGRKSGEGAGAGTGVPVYYSAGKWRVYRDDSEVQA